MIYTNSGRLPIQVEMNEVPDSSKPVHCQEEIPPPIPPKTVQQDNTVLVLMPKQLPPKLYVLQLITLLMSLLWILMQDM